MKRIKLLIGVLGTLIFPGFFLAGETLSLSLDDCLALAEKQSFQALQAALDEKEEAINWDNLHLPFLPAVEYTGEFRDYPDDPPSSATLNQEISIRQRVIDNSFLDLLDEETNRTLVLEISKLEVRKYIRANVRSLYYQILLAQEEIRRMEEMSVFFEADDISPLQNAAKKQKMADIEENMIALRQAILTTTESLLYYIQKPRNTDLVLTTSLPGLVINIEKDSKKALENNIPLKYFILDLKRARGDLDRSSWNYLPHLTVDLTQRIGGQASVGMSAYFYGGDNFALDLIGGYEFQEHTLYYDPADNPGFASPSTAPEDSLDYTITLEYSLSSYFQTKNNRKLYQNTVERRELDIKEQTVTVMAEVEIKEKELNLLEKRIEVNIRQMEATRELLSAIDSGLPITSIEELNYYQSQLDSLLNRMTTVNSYYNLLYTNYIDYLIFLEG